MKKEKPEVKTTNSYLEARIDFPSDISDDLKAAIIEVLAKNNFSKLSYPMAAYAYEISDELMSDIYKTTVVGYIKKFIKDENKFIFNVYNSLREKIEKYSDPVIRVAYREYDGKLAVITKLIVTDNNNKVALAFADTDKE